jgi:hypothetical protein
MDIWIDKPIAREGMEIVLSGLAVPSLDMSFP